MVANGIPSQTRAPAIPRWRIPENSVANTNTAIWYAPTRIGQMKREDISIRTVIILSNYCDSTIVMDLYQYLNLAK